MLYDANDHLANLQADNMELKKAVRDLQKENKEIKVMLKDVHQITVPRYISLPLKSFDERKKARLVIIEHKHIL